MDPRLPGITMIDQTLQDALTAKAPGKPYVNRLARETSPYLLQHAHNPVNWFPWGPEAFGRGRSEGKLLLISVGYSTCHWCHVMEHESFEDEEIAAFINANYVPIKVDREERPDVDAVYMTAVQLNSGHGGWPMTVFAMPDGRPVFAGTYFPARDGDRGARVGFLSLLREVARRYRESPSEFERQAQVLTHYLQPEPRATAGVPSVEAVAALARELTTRFDPVWGGFDGAPKFPRPTALDAALQIWARTRDPELATVVTTTLERMAAGGMHDQVGGGFHRYSVDAFWLVPHFEKMLYDNAQLAMTYLSAGTAFGRPAFHAVARRTLDYLLREMCDSAGGLHSATDADSARPDGHLEEGWFFTWTPAELTQVLGPELARRAADLYGVTPEGNFEGRSVLHLPRPLPEGAEAEALGINRLLYAARAGRPAPRLDDKVITAWNGLAIAALARAGFVLNEARYLDAARTAARFIRDRVQRDGRLARTFRAGEARHAAVLDDHAFFIQGLLELFEATGEGEWLTLACAEQKELDTRFWDEEGGGYFFTSSDGERLLVRDKPGYDGAEPAGNSVAARNLLRLAQLTDVADYRRRAERIFAAFAFNLERGPVTVPAMVAALDWLHGEPLEIVITGSDPALLDVVRRTFAPLAVRVIACASSPALPLLEGRGGNETRAYVCRGGRCELPATTAAELARQLPTSP